MCQFTHRCVARNSKETRQHDQQPCLSTTTTTCPTAQSHRPCETTNRRPVRRASRTALWPCPTPLDAVLAAAAGCHVAARLLAVRGSWQSCRTVLLAPQLAVWLDAWASPSTVDCRLPNQLHSLQTWLVVRKVA